MEWPWKGSELHVHLKGRCQFFNPLTPWAFCQICVFFDILLVFRLDIDQITVALIWLKRHLQHNSLLFLPLTLRFTTFWLGRAQRSKLWDFEIWKRKCFTSLGFLILFFHFSFFSFSFIFAAVIDLLLGLPAVEKLLRKHHWDGQFLPWSSQVYWQEILLWVFHSSFWAFLCIHVSQAPLGRSLWSGHHWKNAFPCTHWTVDLINLQFTSKTVWQSIENSWQKASWLDLMSFSLVFLNFPQECK